MQLSLGLWQGEYEGISRQWLRWIDSEGDWIPTTLEQAERQRDQAKRQRDQAQGKAAHFAAKLRELGIDPSQV